MEHAKTAPNRELLPQRKAECLDIGQKQQHIKEPLLGPQAEDHVAIKLCAMHKNDASGMNLAPLVSPRRTG